MVVLSFDRLNLSSFDKYYTFSQIIVHAHEGPLVHKTHQKGLPYIESCHVTRAASRGHEQSLNIEVLGGWWQIKKIISGNSESLLESMVTLIMMATKTDNLATAFTVVAKTILQQHVHMDIRMDTGITEYQAMDLRHRLKRVEAGPTTTTAEFRREYCAPINVGFRRLGATREEIEMNVRFAIESLTEVDEAGNDWHEVTPIVTLSWSSNNTDVKTSLERLELFQMVVCLATEVKTKLEVLGKINTLYCTAEEKAKQKAKQTDRSAMFALEKTVGVCAKNMRVGGASRYVSHAQMMVPLHGRVDQPFERVPNGEYSVSQGKTILVVTKYGTAAAKQYKIVVTNNGGTIRRTV